ncbi:hypothetical protein CY658_04930 [Variovorax sp. RO1]|uniref:hypothetical protein n=1 Tax=Variovorax sp. RO1 TaxID=2066034 RepID=UPI000C716D07|nr:hypothetical protein [Variovorax sp. RO1]PLC06381.1 hypothetical protein CY658_04930 [Variovorax sp. RO1]
MRCIQCSHWDLKHSTLRAHGYGLCKALVPAQPGRTFSDRNACRFGKFAQAPAETVAKREKVIG